MRGKPAVWHRFTRCITGTDDPKKSSVLLRMALIVTFLLIGFSWALGQSSVYQVTQASILSGRGDHRVRKSHQMIGLRGQILDRTGRGLLAVTVPSPRVEFKGAPYYVDRTELGFVLAEALELDADWVITRIIAEDDHALIKRNITDEEVATIQKLGLPGVRIGYEKRRFYPMGSVFGPELGFVKDGRGNRGLEAWYDGHLKGEERRIKVLRDSRRRGLYEGGTDRPWNLDGSDQVSRQQRALALGASGLLVEVHQLELGHGPR